MFCLRVFIGAAALLLLVSTSAFADIELPAPQQEGGLSVFEALDKRSSAPGGDFSPAQVSLEELSTILWAASGKNRNGNGWTAPMAHGVPPYCRIYVAGADGVFVYDWEAHSLKEISRENIKAKIGEQSFVAKACYVLIFVADGAALAQFKEDAQPFAYIAAGAMSQNMYLAAAALKLGVRYIHSIYKDEIVSALVLPEGDAPLCLMLLSK